MVVAGVIWTVLTFPAIFHSTVKLKCEVPQDICCDTNVRKWSRSPESHLLLFNGKPTKDGFLKYSEKIEKNAFILEIHNFSAEDVNKNYTCSYGFEAYSKPLPIAGFELHPSNETLEASFDLSARGEINISVTFKKVYPIPRCTLIVDGRNESTKLMSDYSKGDIFYSAEYTYNNNTCKNSFIFNCSVGQGYSFVEEHQCNNNSDAKVNRGQFESLIYLPIFVAVMLPACIIVWCYRANKKKKNSDQNSTDQGGNEESSLPMMTMKDGNHDKRAENGKHDYRC